MSRGKRKQQRERKKARQGSAASRPAGDPSSARQGSKGEPGSGATATRDPLDALTRATGGGAGATRRELWPFLAYGLLAATAIAYVLLGSRPGGSLPVFVFRPGRDLLALAALAVLTYAVVRSALARPFLRPGRARAFVALVLVVGIAPFPFPYPTSHVRQPSTVDFRLPAAGEWQVRWGGERGSENQLALGSPDRCTALHLVRPADHARLFAREAPAEPTGWEAFGELLHAPAAGQVVVAVDGVADGPPAAASGLTPEELLGNRVVLEVAPGQFLHISHLRQGSLQVSVGDRVEAGQPVGSIGSSALTRITPLPHVALHLSDSPLAGAGEGIPWGLVGYRSGRGEVSRGMPRGGLEQGPTGEVVLDPALGLGQAAGSTGAAAGSPGQAAESPGPAAGESGPQSSGQQSSGQPSGGQ